MLKNHHEKIKKRELKRKEVVLWGLLVKSNWACAETKKSVLIFFLLFLDLFRSVFSCKLVEKKICGSYYRRMCVLWNCQLIFELNVQESLHKLFEGKVFFILSSILKLKGKSRVFYWGGETTFNCKLTFNQKHEYYIFGKVGAFWSNRMVSAESFDVASVHYCWNLYVYSVRSLTRFCFFDHS